jgi:hypothetical protein
MAIERDLGRGQPARTKEFIQGVLEAIEEFLTTYQSQ